jgi:2-polyprenyl-6-methoxyphenol hydroxylase-like FAD-dependent oxidoreductase
MPRMRVAVVGCGTGGPAAALLLDAAGHEVTVFERVPDPMPVGAGLLLQPTGLAVLRRLGLLDQVIEGGARVDRLRGVTARGRKVLDLAYADLAPDLFGLGVTRGVLFEALFGAVSERGIELRLGVEIDHAENGTLRDTAGASHGPFDLVVAADGARSQLRAVQAPGLVKKAKRYRWGALWAIGDDPEDRFGGVLAQVYRGTREMVGFLPSGRGKVSMFWSIHAGDVEAWRAAGLDRWKQQVRGLAPHAEPLLAQLTHLDQVVHAAYHDVVLRRPYAGRLVFLGDAGHAMSPQLGQGANLALVDAAVLADSGGDLAAFAAARRNHVRFYTWASRLLTPLFQSRIDVLAPPRDALMGPAQRIPPIRRQFLASLAGAKAGPFQTPVPPPP